MTGRLTKMTKYEARAANRASPVGLVLGGLALTCALCGFWVSRAYAQVQAPTAADLAGYAGVGPPGVRPDRPTDAKPSSDPRNIDGMYHIALGGGPGGPGGARGGSPPGGGAPGGGPPGGGRPGGGGGPGGAPGGGAPGGGAPGGSLARRFCIPSFVALGGVEGGTEVLQTPDKIVIVSEEEHTIRRIYLNAQHPAVVTPSLNGDSVGHWDGNVLVVDTVGKITGVGAAAVGETPQHTIEHIEKVDGGKYLQDTMINPDGTAGNSSRLQWAPSQDIAEWICEDNSAQYMSKNYK
jgi:hypothetical protein